MSKIGVALAGGGPLGGIYEVGACVALEEAIDGLSLVPMGRIGTSNRVSAARVRLEFDAPGALVILPRGRLDAAIRALCPAGDGAGGR